MKNYFIILFLVVLAIACGNSVENSDTGTPAIEFAKSEFDFGTIKMGERVTCDFIFENTGTGDLLISKVDADCGCTIANFKTDAIKPGEKSTIEATFDSNGLPGFQLKKLSVYSNAGEPIVLTVSAVVDYELN